MSVALDSKAGDAAIAVQLIQVAAVAADREIDIPRSHVGSAAAGVDQRDRAVVGDRESGNRAAMRVRGIAELAVLRHRGPARRSLVGRNRTARDREGAVAADQVGRCAARRFRYEQIIAMPECEAERRPAGGRTRAPRTADAVAVDRVEIDPIGRLLRHDQPITVWAERHLRWSDTRAGQGSTRALSGADAEAADVSGAAGIQDVQQVAVNRDTARPDATGRDPTHEGQARRRDAERADVV